MVVLTVVVVLPLLYPESHLDSVVKALWTMLAVASAIQGGAWLGEKLQTMPRWAAGSVVLIAVVALGVIVTAYLDRGLLLIHSTGEFWAPAVGAWGGMLIIGWWKLLTRWRKRARGSFSQVGKGSGSGGSDRCY